MPGRIKDKTGSAATRKKALDREKVKTDSNHVPTSVDAYNDGVLEEWFDDRDLATDLQLSLNKNRLASMGSFSMTPKMPSTLSNRRRKSRALARLSSS